jgi:hypothetical protein
MKRTFVVELVADSVETFRGTVRHVGTGEEFVFTSPEKLVDFMERMGAAGGLGGDAWPPGMIDGGSGRHSS